MRCAIKNRHQALSLITYLSILPEGTLEYVSALSALLFFSNFKTLGSASPLFQSSIKQQQNVVDAKTGAKSECDVTSDAASRRCDTAQRRRN